MAFLVWSREDPYISTMFSKAWTAHARTKLAQHMQGFAGKHCKGLLASTECIGIIKPAGSE